jgi:hypothetical protein
MSGATHCLHWGMPWQRHSTRCERVGELELLRERRMWLELHAARLLCMAADPAR